MLPKDQPNSNIQKLDLCNVVSTLLYEVVLGRLSCSKQSRLVQRFLSDMHQEAMTSVERVQWYERLLSKAERSLSILKTLRKPVFFIFVVLRGDFFSFSGCVNSLVFWLGNSNSSTMTSIGVRFVEKTRPGHGLCTSLKLGSSFSFLTCIVPTGALEHPLGPKSSKDAFDKSYHLKAFNGNHFYRKIKISSS